MNEPITVPQGDELLDQAQIAKALGKSVAWCERARWSGSGVPFLKIGRSVRYRRKDLESWLAAQLHVSTRHRAEAA